MTCIVGIVHKGAVYLGGDSAGVGGLFLHVREDRKVFEKDGFVFGFTSSFRMGQLLQHSFVAPPARPSDEPFAYMCTAFVDAVRACLKAGGYAKKDSEVESGGTFLVGYAGRLFRVESDYQVAETVDGYDAVGCGAEVALGSLFTSKSASPAKRIETALEAAHNFSAGVRPPFHVVTLGVKA